MSRKRFLSSRPVLLATLALGVCAVSPSLAEGLEVRIEPLYLEAFGHDQPVLAVRGGSADGTHEATTDSGPGYHFEVRRPADRWGWGVDFFWFSSPQSLADLDVAAAPGEAAFGIADRELVSAGVEEPLYYRLLADNDIAAWTLDVYGLKTLGEREGRTLRLQVGVRAADFDNDYRAALGVGSIGGVRLDSSSNYDRMHGPIVGIIAFYDRGRSGFELAASQSVVFGTVNLAGAQSDFDGPFLGETQTFTSVSSFERPKDVTIPITDLQAKWRRELGRRSALTAGVTASAWWGVSVPPGVIATAGREAEDENTITLVGLLVGIEF